MDNKLHQETVKAAVKPKFGRKKALESKATPRYPSSAEREYRRVTDAYMKLLKYRLKQHMPEILSVCKDEMRNDSADSRMDSLGDLKFQLSQIFMKIAAQLEKDIERYSLTNRLTDIAYNAKGTAYREWKRTVKNTLGVNLLDDYYSGDFYREILQKWIDDNTLKIKSIPTTELGTLQQTIYDSFVAGKHVTDIESDIMAAYDISAERAKAIARDQISTLNAQITKRQHEDAGVKRYKWSDSGDERVRDCHASLNGQIFSYDEPPEMWYMTKSRGLVRTGRYCSPGEDFCCRCVAIPVFDFDTVDLPIKDKNE